MAEAFNLYVGDGVTVLYPFTFEYLETDDIYVSVDSQPNTNWVLSSATEITFNSAPANGADIIIFRRTDIDSMEAVFAAASVIRAKDLNLDFTQLRLAIEENRDLLSEAQINELTDLFWNKGSETLYQANTWEASDLKIASTAAINAYVTNAIANVSAGVSRLVAGDNIILNPSDGLGIVTINSTGGSGGIVYKGTRDLTQPAPNAPEDGDLYINTATSGTVNNTWTGIGGQALTGSERVVYNGSSWDMLPPEGGGGGGASVEVGDTAPANPSEGDLWWDSSTDSGQLYIYYVDGNSSQWVEASSSAGGGGGGVGDLQSVTDAGNTTTNGATFAGGDLTITDAGRLNSTEVNTYGTAGFIANNSPGSGGFAWRGANASGTNTSTIDYDGSATFGGGLSAANGEFSVSTDGSVIAHNRVLIYKNDASYPYLIECRDIDGGGDDTRTFTVAPDGSAEFAGSINCGTKALEGNTTNAPIFRGYNVGSSSPTSVIASNGSAEFAGTVSIGGTAAANTISEYEEGTWTPTLGGNSTFNIQWGRYVKIGTFVQCWGGLRPTNIGTGDPARILGLPFTSSSPAPGTDQGGGSIVWGDGAAVDYVSAVISVAIQNTQATINVKTEATKVSLAGTAFWANNFRSNFYFCYVTTS